MSVLLVSLLLIGVLLVGLLVALVDPELPRRLVRRLPLEAWQGRSRRSPRERVGGRIIDVQLPLRRGNVAVPTKLMRAVGVEGERAAKAAWLRRNGRLYELVGVAADGSSLYQSVHLGRDFWLVRPEGSERPWNYRTQFGRKRPLPPPTGRWQRPG